MRNIYRVFLIIIVFIALIILPEKVNAATELIDYIESNLVNPTSTSQNPDITVDNQGNIFLTGNFNSTYNFGENYGESDIKTLSSGNKLFITKINSDGSYGWTKTFGVEGSVARDSRVATNSNGDVFLVGAYAGTVNFASDFGGTDNKTAVNTDLFITKVNSDGSYGWTRVISGIYGIYPQEIDIDNSGNIVFTAYTVSTGTINFANDWGGTDNKTMFGGFQIFVTKLNSDGSYNWTRLFNSRFNYGITFDSSNNIYLTGTYTDDIDFGSDWGVSDLKTLRSTQPDIYLMKILSNSNYGFTYTFGSTNDDYGYDVEIDSSSNIYLTGYVRGTTSTPININFADDFSGDDTKLLTAQYAFIVKINSNETYAWSRILRNNGGSIGRNIDYLDGSLYLSGYFNQTSLSTNILSEFGTTYTFATSSYDSFILKVEPDGSSTSNDMYPISGPESTYIAKSTLFQDNIILVGRPPISEVLNIGNYWGISDILPSSNGQGVFYAVFNLNLATAVTNLGGTLDAIDLGRNASAEVESTTHSSTNSRQIRLQNTSGDVIAQIDVDLTDGDRDWTNVTADTDVLTGKSVVANLTTAPGTASTHSLYIPKVSGTDGVRICPDATSLAQVTSGCSNEYLLSENDFRVSTVTIEGQDYYRVTGLTGTGGEGESGVPSTLPLRIVLRDSELAGASTDTEVWINSTTDITANTQVFVTYDTNHTGGSAITTSDITVTCDADGYDPLTGTGMTTVTVVDSQNGYLELNTGTDSCSNWMVVDINGGGGNQLTNPAQPGNYSWGVAYDVGNDGSTEVQGATLAYVVDENDVLITANVIPVLDLELYEAGVDNLLNGTGANTCELGVLSINTVKTCSYDIGTGTNNTSGVSVYIQSDGELRDGSGNTIDACSGTNCDSLGGAGIDAGEEEYGIYISELGGGEYSAAGSFGTQYQAVPTTETLFASSSSTGSGTTVNSITQRMEVTHGVSISTATAQGSYSQLVTFSAFTN